MTESPGSKVEAAKTIIMEGVEKALTSIYSRHSKDKTGPVSRKYALQSHSGTSIFNIKFNYALPDFDQLGADNSCEGAGTSD